jgi:hypothetical protein
MQRRQSRQTGDVLFCRGSELNTLEIVSHAVICLK